MQHITFSIGDWFQFTEGPYRELPAIVTDVWSDEGENVQVCYDLIGDGRNDTLNKNVVYELSNFCQDEFMVTAKKLIVMS